jgi:hypothetical protein
MKNLSFETLAVAVLTTILYALIVQVCWNFLVPAILINVPEITLFQALMLRFGVQALRGGIAVEERN